MPWLLSSHSKRESDEKLVLVIKKSRKECLRTEKGEESAYSSRAIRSSGMDSSLMPYLSEDSMDERRMEPIWIHGSN
jgi:hypothetical protein